ncbi:MAG: hypothetical protein K0T53_01915 [Wolbachia pipientis]|nr:hypothetical protein [Wolbachia pipientis]
MSGKAQGPNIAEWQAQQRYQEERKSGFGLGYSDSIATIIDGMKWLFNFHEGVIAAYNNVFESLISGSSLIALFGKSDNMFGIKFLDGLAEHFSGEGEDAEGRILEGMDTSPKGEGSYFDDYPHFSNEMAYNTNGLYNMFDSGNHHDQFFSSNPSLSICNNDYEHELSV